MDQASDCRRRAEEADRQAERADDPEAKRMYEGIAAAWRRLADFIERTKIVKMPDPGKPYK